MSRDDIAKVGNVSRIPAAAAAAMVPAAARAGLGICPPGHGSLAQGTDSFIVHEEELLKVIHAWSTHFVEYLGLTTFNSSSSICQLVGFEV